MATANTYQMGEIGRYIDLCASNLKKDIESLSTEANAIQKEYDRVKSYNGKWLKGEERDGQYSQDSMQKTILGKKYFIGQIFNTVKKE